MKTLLILLTLAVIGWCLDIRTDGFHPVMITYRIGKMLDPRGWPEVVMLLLFLVVACLCVAPFFTPNKRPLK